MPGFLIDENLPPAIARQLRQRAPEIEVLVIGDSGAPPKSTLDPQILDWLAENDYWLITNNRASMPGHLRDHLTANKHIPGIFIVSSPLRIGPLLEDLVLIWGASLPGEYQDRIVYLPLSRRVSL